MCFGDCCLMVDESINVHPEMPRTSVHYLYPDDMFEYHKQIRESGVDAPELNESF